MSSLSTLSRPMTAPAVCTDTRLERKATIAYIIHRIMPTVHRFATCKIAMYANDHLPPHFHIEGRGFRAIVEIETMLVRAGTVRRAGEAMAWAHENTDLLRAEWQRLSRRP